MGLLLNRCINFLIDRGLLFVVLWAFSAVYVVKSKKVLGLELSEGDKGFILVLLVVAYMLAHHFIIFWKSRSRYYAPSSFSEETREATIEARGLVFSAAHFLKSPIYSDEEKKDFMKDKHTRTHEIASRLQSSEVEALFLKCMINVSIEALTGKNVGLKDVRKEFDSKTSWIRKK